LNHEKIYASQLACSAAGLAPEGVAHEHDDTYCSMCGRAIVQGVPSMIRDLPRSFSDHESLRPSQFICGWCAAIIPQKILRAFQRAVVTPVGVYNLNKDEARAWFWLTPPEPPFAVVIHNGSALAAFHYIWRTPVTLDRRLITVNFDGVVAHVRHAVIGQAVSHLAVLQEHAARDGHKKPLNTPFKMLNRASFTSPASGHGVLNEITQSLAAKHSQCAESALFFSSLNNAELTALSAILKSNPVPPQQPPLLRGKDLID
jgi:CRISPR type IV-associated protein Csf1